MENHYTTPQLKMGKTPLRIEKNSTKEIELAKNSWYIEYRYNNKQIRVRPNSLNRIKDPKEKLYRATIELDTIKQQLKDGYNPLNPSEYISKIAIEYITLNDAITNYLEDFAKYNNRPKSIGTYKSKLIYLNEFYPNKVLNQLTTNDVEQYIYSKIHSNELAIVQLNGKKYECKTSRKWTPNTVKSARRIFSAFLNWCVKEKYIEVNPASKLDLKKVRSEVVAQETNVPLSTTDLTKLMTDLDTNDTYLAFFVRFMFSTCLRPKEISLLQLKDIDLISKTITIPLNVTKNTKKNDTDRISIEPSLLDRLTNLNLSNYNQNSYIVGDLINIIGADTIGNNRPYKRFVSALKRCGLNGKGYTLYSIKHTSNIMRLQSGWSIDKLKKANRHSTIQMTENYLKDISKLTDISTMAVPII